MLVMDKHVVLVNDGCAVHITQFPQTDDIVGKTRHDVSCLGMQGWDGRDGQESGCRGGVHFAGGCADHCTWGADIDVDNRSHGGEVVITGPCVGDGMCGSNTKCIWMFF